MQQSLKLLLCTGTLAFLTAAQPAAAQVATLTKLRFAVHDNVNPVPLTAVSNRLATASNAFITDAGVNDIACNLTLQRLDAGYSFFGGGSTDQPATAVEYRATRDNSSDAYLVVVNQINWCDGTQTVTGCAYDDTSTLRKPFMVARSVIMNSDAGGIIIAHEFGHSQKLPHDDLVASQIMSGGSLGSVNTRVKNSGNCNGFRLPFQATCPSGTSGPSGSAICSPNQTSSLLASGIVATEQGATRSYTENDFSGIEIRTLASAMFVDRVPVEAEDYYGEDDVAILRDLLRNTRDDAQERTILTLIGLISDGNDEDVLGGVPNSGC